MSLKKQALSGMMWTYIQQFGGQFVTFIVSIILARILLPQEFGLIGMLSIFIGIGTALFEGGLTSSLIRTKELVQEDYSTVFFFNIAASLGIYVVLFFVAPYISEFYSQPRLTIITRVYGVTFMISGLSTVQNTILTRELNFKKQAIITFPALLISSIIGVASAYLGYGVWSLVFSAISNSIFVSLFLWISSDWYPKFIFSKAKFQQHFYYGYKLTLSSVLDILFTNIYQIVIGRFYSPSQVGYYARANSLMMLPVGNISGALNRVIFPIFAKIQDDLLKLKEAYRKIMLLVMFIINPILILLALLAKPIVILLFTEIWLPMVPILQIICLTGLLYPIHLYNLIILQVKGRTDLFLRLEILKKIIIVCILPISMFFGLYGLLFGQLLSSICALFINTHYAGKILNYGALAQLKDLMPIFMFSILMGVVVMFLDHFLVDFANYLRLLLSGTAGAVSYFLFAWIFKFESLSDIKNLIYRNDTSN